MPASRTTQTTSSTSFIPRHAHSIHPPCAKNTETDPNAHLRRFDYDYTYRTAVTQEEFKEAEEEVNNIKNYEDFERYAQTHASATGDFWDFPKNFRYYSRLHSNISSTEGDLQWVAERINMAKNRAQDLSHDITSLENQRDTLLWRMERHKKTFNDDLALAKKALRDGGMAYRQMDEQHLIKQAYKNGLPVPTFSNIRLLPSYELARNRYSFCSCCKRKGHLAAHHWDTKCDNCGVSAPGHYPPDCPRPRKKTPSVLPADDPSTSKHTTPTILPSPVVEKTTHRKNKKSAQKKKKVTWGIVGYFDGHFTIYRGLLRQISFYEDDIVFILANHRTITNFENPNTENRKIIEDLNKPPLSPIKETSSQEPKQQEPEQQEPEQQEPEQQEPEQQEPEQQEPEQQEPEQQEPDDDDNEESSEPEDSGNPEESNQPSAPENNPIEQLPPAPENKPTEQTLQEPEQTNPDRPITPEEPCVNKLHLLVKKRSLDAWFIDGNRQGFCNQQPCPNRTTTYPSLDPPSRQNFEICFPENSKHAGNQSHPDYICQEDDKHRFDTLELVDCHKGRDKALYDCAEQPCPHRLHGSRAPFPPRFAPISPEQTEDIEDNMSNKEIQINKTSEFNRDRSRFAAWRNEWTLYLDINSKIYDDDVKKIGYVLSYMTSGEALLWRTQWTREKTTSGKITYGTFLAFTTELEKTFAEVYDEPVARQKLLQLKQTQGS
ncbi:hypothetical protein EST38_g13711 [Candolleomyces aberdarensis]|uniref:Retrotransposon gag domain-containing protein n=1 Tax=Candolleomyces aberdarensis TaxID=2316362 RepID=A0A4Q2CZ92_9AGAR|nr:hypothetical protein EST38_g13711 [Candolleomyces aberdarensis]